MKRLYCFLFACGSVLAAMADDSATTYPEDWTYGNMEKWSNELFRFTD